MIVIAALGTPGNTTSAAAAAVRDAEKLFYQSALHPCCALMRAQGFAGETMDDLYESSADFDEWNAAVAERLMAAGPCVYAVPGSGAGKGLIDALNVRGAQWRALPGVGFAETALASRAHENAYICAANALPEECDTRAFLAIEEIDGAIRAGEVKLKLMDFYPDDWQVVFCQWDEKGAYAETEFPLYELDRQPIYSPAGALLVPPVPFEQLTRYGYRDLEAVMRRLRAPGGCPWDREQTHLTLKKDLLEESYEVLDAIDSGDDAALCEELGDLLLQCVFHAEIARGQGRFTGRDVSTGIVRKMVYRHPHIFADAEAADSEAVLKRWDELKKEEKHYETQTDVLRAVPRNLPALIRAEKVQKRAARVGFDWPDMDGALPKITEELHELLRAVKGDGDVEEELGDLLFAVVNVARFLGCEPELALLKTADKFIDRFAQMERLARENGNELEKLTLEELDSLWEKAKNLTKSAKVP